MITTNHEVQLYVDTLIVQTLLTDDGLSKTAQAGGFVSSLISKVKEYFGNHINPEDKAGSVLNMLAPGLISTTLAAMGLPWIGTLMGLATTFFHIDVASMVRSIWSALKGAISGNKQTTSAEVDSIVDAAVKEHDKPPTAEEAQKAIESAQQQKSSSQQLREAKLLKLAMIQYDQAMTKEAIPIISDVLGWFTSRKSSTGSLLGSVLGWIFKVALASAGLLVAGDVMNKFLNRPNALDGSLKDGKPTGESATPVVPAVVSKQTKFKVNPSYREASKGPNGWVENCHNDAGSIANMILGWAKEVYQGLDGLDSIIQNTPGFQALVDTITFHNNRSAGGPIVFIPPMFTSKKMVVDHFIDDVAEKAP